MKILHFTASLILLSAMFSNCTSPKINVPPGQHEQQVEEKGAVTPPQELEHVLTGLDVLQRMDFEPLVGKNVGIITNHTALNREGQHLVDLLHAHKEVGIAAIFGPEHGFRGDAQAGDAIPGGVDSATGAPVYSLYGKDREPTAQMLEGIDLLIYDIQDVGARFYTYISTMGYVLEAGAKHDIPVMILDRPNPIGRKTDGNVLDEGYESFVGRYPIPIQYGLTIGELARMILGENMIPGLEHVELHVVECEGWSGGVWQNTDLKWTPPSPNMRNTTETLTYPGLCLLEGVRINEGRGTEMPFEVFGTPYMDAARVIQLLLDTDLRGCTLEPHVYTPVDMPGVAMNPIFEGERVQGIRIRVQDPHAFAPIPFVIHFLSIMKNEYPNQFEWRYAKGPDRLWGGGTVCELQSIQE